MGNNNPLISIVVPIYKVEQYLDECVESLIRQTYKNIEIILVDDGSPDRCPQMCDEWATRDNRIQVIHKKNGGLSSARNTGKDVAQGEFIGFVDSDDFVDERMYEKLLQGFDSDKNVGITAVKILSYVDGKKKPFRKDWDIFEHRVVKPEDFAIKMIGQECSFTAWNKLYKASLVKNVDFKAGRNNEDTRYMYDLSKEIVAHNLCLLEVPYPAYYYRIRPESICTTAKVPLAVDVIANYKDMMKEDYCKSNPSLFNQIKTTYLIKLISFMDELFVRKEWYALYYSEYHGMLNEFTLSYTKSNIPKKMVYIFLLQKYFPIVRRIIHKR